MHSLIFFGSDQYSAIVLNSLLSSSISLVITNRPKPKGKDHLVEQNPIEKLAIKHHLKVAYYPNNIEDMNKFVKSLPTTNSIGLSASFDHLLPPQIITIFKGNIFNLHPSLLPQYRNVSPVQYAIALGDKETGITLFKISTGIDNGEIIAQLTEPIIRPNDLSAEASAKADTTPTLTSRLFSLGAQLFITHLTNQNVKGRSFVKPPSSLVFTKRLTRNSGFVDWDSLHNLLRNIPITHTQTTNELLKLRLQKISSSKLEFSAWNLVLSDLIRSLTPWPTVWSTFKSSKGELRLSVLNDPNSPSNFLLHLAGKPNPITLSDFTKYYL